MHKLQPVVFLDRDGTLNEEVGYITEIRNLKLVQGAGISIKKLNQAGVAAVLVTNQTGAARGYYPEEHILNLNKRLEELLSAEGAHLDAVYYCPHYNGGKVAPYNIDCKCRKPEVGMVEQAYSEHSSFDKTRSYVVGDKATDVELAQNCGARGILLRTGYGERVISGEYQWQVEPDYTANDICDAIDWILQDLKVKA
jgi:D-glycero-D-manno-heptose 1,7-bisphosphate phosphatase